MEAVGNVITIRPGIPASSIDDGREDARVH